MYSEISSPPCWPSDGLERVKACPLCGASERVLVHSFLRDHFFECAPGEWQFYQCGRCESGYLDPRPSPNSISLAYSNYYTHQKYNSTSNGLRGVWHALRDDYMLAAFGARSTRTLWPGRWVVRLFPLGRAGLDSVMARHLEQLPNPDARLLDVGCGNGNYLEFARRAGWNVRGIDLDPAAVGAACAQGLDVIEGTIDLLDGESGCYDRITLSHILEHVYDPWSVLERCYRLLKPGGGLWLETPNVNSMGHDIFGPNWRGLEPPRHLHLFSRKCLRDKIAEIGFTSIEDRFSSFATAAIWRESKVIVKKSGAAQRSGHTLIGQFLAEISALFSSNSREFITLICKK